LHQPRGGWHRTESFGFWTDALHQLKSLLHKLLIASRGTDSPAEAVEFNRIPHIKNRAEFCNPSQGSALTLADFETQTAFVFQNLLAD
jgi:hypothetical protein